MKFLTDVNITKAVIEFLRNLGHDASDIKSINRQMADTEIIEIAIKEKRIILTHDKDFLILLKYPKYQTGTILIRLEKQNSEHFCQKLQELIEKFSEDKLISSLTILEENSAIQKSFSSN